MAVMCKTEWKPQEAERLLELAKSGATSKYAALRLNDEFHGKRIVRTMKNCQSKLGEMRYSGKTDQTFGATPARQSCRSGAWPKEQKDFIRELVQAGKSYNEVMVLFHEKFETNLTRSTVAGVVDRLKQQGHSFPAFGSKRLQQLPSILGKAKVKEKDKPKPSPTTKSLHGVRDASTLIKTPDLSYLPIATGENLVQIGRFQCKSVEGRNEHNEAVYCGHRVDPGSSYCPHHRALYVRDTINVKRLAHDLRRYAGR